jgi:hypothetical protein
VVVILWEFEPRDEDVTFIAAGVFRRVERMLAGRVPDLAQRRFVEDAPLLVAVVEVSASGRIATGPRRGCRVVHVRGVVEHADAIVMGRLCAQVEGYNLPTLRGGTTGERVERACYGARGRGCMVSVTRAAIAAASLAPWTWIQRSPTSTRYSSREPRPR